MVAARRWGKQLWLELDTPPPPALPLRNVRGGFKDAGLDAAAAQVGARAKIPRSGRRAS